jgi:hypothetical protein
MKKALLLIVCGFLGGCASYRMVNRAEWLGQEQRNLVEREVLRNLSRTVLNPYSIPSRTQLSPEIKMTFTDNATMTAALPLSGSGQSLGLELGAVSDQYSGAVSAETNPNALRDLRELYRFAVWQAGPTPNLDFFKKHRGVWLYWVSRTGQGQDNKPIEGMPFLGSSQQHDFYGKQEVFSDFVLETLGSPARSAPINAQAKAAAAGKAAARPRPAAATGQIPSQSTPATPSPSTNIYIRQPGLLLR